ncbi:MAG TPA: hypothetical protein VKB79_29690 [Bryobacteraceae bacterium]|nr:hypothetical protein [Bryobacteraceae bacterium]
MRSLPKGQLLTFAAVSTLAAQLPYQQLFERASADLSANLKRLPEYTCIETQDRTHSQLPHPTSGCNPSAEAAARSAKSRLPVWRDRVRVEVAEGSASEMFSWVGERAFHAVDVHQLMELGTTGTGDFSAFLKTIFSGGADHFQYKGEQKTAAGHWSIFDYSVPLSKSSYVYSDGAAVEKTIGYHGSLFIDSDAAQLQRLTVTAEGFVGHACRIEHEIDYGTVKVGDTDIRLPKESTMAVLYDDGEEAVNRTQYSGCRRYEVQSSLSFGDSDALATSNSKSPAASVPEIPGDTTLDVALHSPIDSLTAAAGDPVTAVVKRDAATLLGNVVAHKGDLLHGRLLRVAEMIGLATWIVAIRFDEIEHAGIRQPIRLRPLDDGERLLIPKIALRRIQGDYRPAIPPRPPNSGVFAFEGNNRLLLDSSFQSRWITQ